MDLEEGVDVVLLPSVVLLSPELVVVLTEGGGAVVEPPAEDVDEEVVDVEAGMWVLSGRSKASNVNRVPYARTKENCLLWEATDSARSTLKVLFGWFCGRRD